jgi:hypothetical protein
MSSAMSEVIRSAMSGAWWRLAEQVSLLLEPDERNAVAGDLAESGASGPQALAGLLGLVARRQAALWKDWRPWLALSGVVPLSFLLARKAADLADTTAVYVWMYLDNWRMADMSNSAYWRLMTQEAAPILLACCMLMAGAWASGMAIGALARRTAAATTVVFCGAFGLTAISLPPRADALHQAVFDLRFYRQFYPIVLQTTLVLLPALWGIALGRRRGGFIRLHQR